MKKLLLTLMSIVSITAFAQYPERNGPSHFSGVIISPTPIKPPAYLNYENNNRYDYHYPEYGNKRYNRRYDNFERIRIIKERNGNYKVISGMITNKYEDIYLKPRGYCSIRSGYSHINLSNNRKYGLLVERDTDCEVSVHRIRQIRNHRNN